MFCFGLQWISARFINMDVSYFNTNRLESKKNFPETFKSQMEKNKNVIHWPRTVRIGRNCALGLSTAEGGPQDLKFCYVGRGEVVLDFVHK